jgi:ATP-dependent helicase/nuclease subunit B
VRLRGKIDRVDTDGAGQARVIDYKTSAIGLAAHDLTKGQHLQLPLYGLAAQHALGLGEVVEGFYWKIRDAGPGALRLSEFADSATGEVGVGAAYAVAANHVGDYVERIRGGRFAPTPPAGGCPDYCPARAFCWRYQPRGGG